MTRIMAVYGMQEDIVSSSHEWSYDSVWYAGEIVSCFHDWGYDSVWYVGGHCVPFS